MKINNILEIETLLKNKNTFYYNAGYLHNFSIIIIFLILF